MNRSLSLLALLDLNECNGIYQRMVIERIETLASIKSCDVMDLSLRELVTCTEHAALDFNDITPSIFASHTPRPEAAVRAPFQEAAQMQRGSYAA
jgi:hypothetical protein